MKSISQILGYAFIFLLIINFMTGGSVIIKPTENKLQTHDRTIRVLDCMDAGKPYEYCKLKEELK